MLSKRMFHISGWNDRAIGGWLEAFIPFPKEHCREEEVVATDISMGIFL
jgi:hypothetical protein